MEVFVRPGIHLFVGPNDNVHRWLVPHARRVQNVLSSSVYDQRLALNSIVVAQNHTTMFTSIGAPPKNQPTMAFSLPVPSVRANTDETTRSMISLLDAVTQRLNRETRVLIAIPSASDMFHVELHMTTAGLSSEPSPPAHPLFPTEPIPLTNINVTAQIRKYAMIPHTLWHCDSTGRVYDYTIHDFDLTRAARLLEFARRQSNSELTAAITRHKDWGVRRPCTFVSPETMSLDFLRRLRAERRRWRQWIHEWVVIARFIRRANPRAKFLYRRSLSPGGRLCSIAKKRFTRLVKHHQIKV